MFKLVIQDDEGKTTIVPLIRDEITIGRKEGNTIRLTERNVSRRHARILRNNGEVHIEDLGSYNGIRVNNARIAERVSLRVSDQVQIGDYKLYLKAEGLDQVDDSRTTPIERVEPGPTDSMPVVMPQGSPAPQIPVTPVPTVPPMVGNPNRTMVAIADTDPGRAVGPATQAAVAAMTAPGGYGKLVVLSSNFAGKEFELSRPQMIIGRTDENDIVINHRSISRNHAKLTRELETGRYTISDLQSSNGVRVNGSDYGKVELRRGDVVDLGHVRLRFVEAGEDFVFARDAVITDVPEAGGRRGLLFAVLAAIVVLVASAAFYLMRAPSGDNHQNTVSPGPGPSGSVAPDADEAVAVAEPHGSGSSMAGGTATPNPPAGQTEDAAAPVVANPPSNPPGNTVTPPAGSAATAKADEGKAKAAACAQLEVNQKWQELRDCASELAALGVKAKADEFRTKAVKEMAGTLAADRVKMAINEGNLREAQKQLKQIGADSVYFTAASDAFRAAENRAVDDNRRKAQASAQAHDCASVRRLQAQLTNSSTAAVTGAVAAIAVKCVDKVAATPAPANDTPKPPPVETTPPPTPKASACDAMNVDDVMAQAQNQYAAGFEKAALQLANKALACKQTVQMYRQAAMYACGAHDLTTAKVYFNKVPAGQQQNAIEQKCQIEGLNLRAP
jgi:pSer/pThr/pTyr-binding forkhead associated (FHA) protein